MLPKFSYFATAFATQTNHKNAMKARYKFVYGRKKSNPHTVELEIYSKDLRMYVTTGISVEPKHWDASRQCLSAKAPNGIAANEMLRRLKERIEAAELETINSGSAFTKEIIRAAVSGKDTSAGVDAMELFRGYNDLGFSKNVLKPMTHKKYVTTLNMLQQFVDEEARKTNAPLPLNSLNLKFLDRLDVWLQQRYQLTTVAKFHSTIKTFVARAVIEKLLPENPYNGFKVTKGHTKTRDVLTADELARLENLDRDVLSGIDPRLCEVLDRFLLSCYCGLRISDNSSLLKREVVDDNGLVIDKVTEKMMGTRVILPLRILFGGRGERIVQRYLEAYPDIETVFPYIPEPKINLRLKTLAALAKIRFNLTFHIARHTCATMLAEKTGNPFVIMKILGHHDIKTSMIYIHNSYQATIKGLQGVEWEN